MSIDLTPGQRYRIVLEECCTYANLEGIFLRKDGDYLRFDIGTVSREGAAFHAVEPQ